MSSDYDRLAARLISLLDGDMLPLPTMWDLERNEQRIAIAVRDATGMTPEHWAMLDKPSREPWLEKILAVLTAQSNALTQVQSGNCTMINYTNDRTGETHSYSLGHLLQDLASSQSAYEANMREAERIRSQQGAIAAQWMYVQASALKWQPDPARMPGIQSIEILCDQRFGSGITEEAVRRLRAELCGSFGVELGVANALSLQRVADLLSAENLPNRRPTADIQRFSRTFADLRNERNTQKRGFAFEKFLNDLFAEHNLAPRGSFRIAGEQIDGSFEWDGFTYLVEARWRSEPANATDLLVLRGKAEKSDWTRGMFISIAGFSDVASETHRIGRKANLIAVSGDDLTLILGQQWTLLDALRIKLRHTGETGEVYLPLAQIKK
jgi:hypothetical protein